MKNKITPIYVTKQPGTNYEYNQLENWEINGHLLWSAGHDQEIDITVHIALFGYSYEYVEYDEGMIRVDDCLFCSETNNLGKIIEAITDEIKDEHGNVRNSVFGPDWSEVKIEPIEKLYLLFPSLNIQLIRDFEDAQSDWYKYERASEKIRVANDFAMRREELNQRMLQQMRQSELQLKQWLTMAQQGIVVQNNTLNSQLLQNKARQLGINQMAAV